MKNASGRQGPSWRALSSAAGAFVGGTALINLLAARAAEQRHPPRGAFVEVDGVRLHYREAGQGPPLVLIHGNGVSADDFLASGLFERLSARHRVVAFDRPGFGHSSRPRGRPWTAADQADLLARACDALGLERPLVVGHSWGVFVALSLAFRRPAALCGLVLMSGYYIPTPRPDVWLAAPLAAPVLGSLLRWTTAPITTRLMTSPALRLLFAPNKVSEAFRAQYSIEMAARPSQLAASGAEGAAMVREARNVQAGGGALDLPVLLIAGRDDRLVSSRRQTVAYGRQLRTAEVLIIEGAGHMVHHVATEPVAQAIHALASRVMEGPYHPASPSGLARTTT